MCVPAIVTWSEEFVFAIHLLETNFSRSTKCTTIRFCSSGFLGGNLNIRQTTFDLQRDFCFCNERETTESDETHVKRLTISIRVQRAVNSETLLIVNSISFFHFFRSLAALLSLKAFPELTLKPFKRLAPLPSEKNYRCFRFFHCYVFNNHEISVQQKHKTFGDEERVSE